MEETQRPTPNAQRRAEGALVDRLCAELFLTTRARETDDNLTFVWHRILQRNSDAAALLTLYRQVWRGRRVRDDAANPLMTELKLAGIVRVEAGLLRVRNRIYAREFYADWVRESMPDAEVRRQRTAFRRGVIRASSIYGTISLVIGGLALATLRQKHLADLNADRYRTAEAHALAEAANARRQLYFANMELAPREWENGRIGHLRQLLDETRDNENRNWEWHYWDRLCHLDLFTIPAYANIGSVAISPDGARLAIPDYYGTKIYETATGREVLSLGKGPPIECRSVAFSPDGRRIALGYVDAITQVWDVQSGRLLRTLKGHTEAIVALSFSSNGKRILTCASNLLFAVQNSPPTAPPTAKVWEVESGRCLRTLPHVGPAALFPDGQRIVTGGQDGIARMWEVTTGRQLAAWTGEGSAITSVAFSPEGQRLALASSDGIVRVRDAASGRLLHFKIATAIRSVAFSADGKRLLTCGYDGMAKVWEAQSGQILLTLRHPDEVTFGIFFPDGRRIVTISGKYAGNVDVWDAWNDRRALRFPAHQEYVVTLAFSPDGKTLVTGGKDSVARVWEVATGRKLRELRGHAATVYAVAYSPDGRRLVTGSDDSTARVWEVQTGQTLCVLKGRGGRVNSVAWSPDGRRIVTGHNDKTAKLWDATTGRETGTLRGHTDYVLSVAFSPDSRQVLTASAGYTAKLWDAALCHATLTVTGFDNWLWSATFSPDGRHLVLGCQDGSAKVVDATTGHERLALLGHTANVHAVAFSPDGKRIATGSHDGTVRMWDAASGRETLLLVPSNAVYSVAYSPDGRCIATGGMDGTVQIWRALD